MGSREIITVVSRQGETVDDLELGLFQLASPLTDTLLQDLVLALLLDMEAPGMEEIPARSITSVALKGFVKKSLAPRLSACSLASFVASAVSTRIGNRVPATVSAAGKILLASQPEAELQSVIAKGIPKFTAQTKTEAQEIVEDIRKTREQGYGFQDREYAATSGGIACAILDQKGAAVAAIAVAIAVGGEAKDEFVAKVLGPTRQAALKASMELGYRPRSHVEVA